MNKKTIKKVIIGMVVFLGITLGVGYIIGTLDTKGTIGNAIEVMTNKTKVDYDLIHTMSNTVVISSEKWGNTKITNELLNQVKESKLYKEDKVIKEEIDKWLNGDFSTSDDLHNYVWDKLGGTVGVANGVDKEEVSKVKKSLGME